MKLSFISLKSVQVKFMIWIIPLITLILTLLAYLLYSYDKEKQTEKIESFSIEIMKARSYEIEKWLLLHVNELQHIARRNMVKTMDWSIMETEFKTIVEEKNGIYDFIALIYPDGYYHSTLKGKSDKSVKNMEYFKQVYHQGAAYAISDPYSSITTGKPIFLINVPVTNESGQVIGCVAGIINLTVLTEIVDDIKIGDFGYGFVSDKNGLIFAHPDEKLAMQLNMFTSSEKGFVDLDKLGERMNNSKFGSGYITDPKGVGKYVVYSRINASPDWSLGIVLPLDKTFENIYFLLKYLIVSFLLTTLIIAVALWILTRQVLSQPLTRLNEFVQAIARGNLYETIDIESSDEVGRMARSLVEMSATLKSIASRIRESSGNIALGSGEISTTANKVSEGSSIQAASTEEVSASIEETLAIINQNSENAEQTEKTATKAALDIEEVNRSVNQSIAAMNKIAEKISIITDIAGKTDMLAVNAAIEAARAGEKGKGFSVVAAEVRKLSEIIQRSAVEIDELSKRTVETVEKSGELLSNVIPVIKANAALVHEINSASTEQRVGAQQVNKAVQELSHVTQSNSAAAEEMATNSEELAQQAAVLKEIVSYFKTEKNERRTDTSDLAYKQLVETLNALGKTQTTVKGNKLEIDLSSLPEGLLQNELGIKLDLDKDTFVKKPGRRINDGDYEEFN